MHKIDRDLQPRQHDPIGPVFPAVKSSRESRARQGEAGRTAESSRGQLAQFALETQAICQKTAGKDPKITSKRDACSASPPRCAPASPPRPAALASVCDL